MASVDWPGLGQFLRLERTTWIAGVMRRSVGDAITSLPPERASPEDLLAMWQGRWEIENRVFWIKDVVLREDHSGIRTGRGPLAMSLVRNATINHLRARNVTNTAADLRENALNLHAFLHDLLEPTN